MPVHTLGVLGFWGNEFGGQGCENGICKCHCVVVKDDLDESCKEIDENTYWFFKYNAGFTFANDG